MSWYIAQCSNSADLFQGICFIEIIMIATTDSSNTIFLFKCLNGKGNFFFHLSRICFLKVSKSIGQKSLKISLKVSLAILSAFYVLMCIHTNSLKSNYVLMWN